MRKNDQPVDFFLNIHFFFDVTEIIRVGKGDMMTSFFNGNFFFKLDLKNLYKKKQSRIWLSKKITITINTKKEKENLHHQ